ncbi:Uncharacterised protein [Acinetobacter baumannii]|uniref:hypothetical protein n=1 Tax=Acinetobacter baumannii TaxID=470 RepID=UPI000DE5F2DF|nr:hypothetical protein [Acinetobacter baumannii]SSQ07945.1 Uncharacterised protein [Acinetobacter baumannii]
MLDPSIPLMAKGIDSLQMLDDGSKLAQLWQTQKTDAEMNRLYKESSGDLDKMLEIGKQSPMARFVMPQLQAQQAAQQKALLDQQKTESEIYKNMGSGGKDYADAGRINTETGITRQNNAASIWNAYLTGGAGAAKAVLEGMKARGLIDDTNYQAELADLTDLDGKTAAEQQQYALGRFKGVQDPKYSLTTADNVLDNQTAVGNNIRDNTTSTDNNIRSTNVQKYGIDKTAETADENRAVQMQRLEFDQQQAEIKNGQGEIKEANGKLWIVYKDGTARPAVDANGTQLASNKTNNPQAQAQNEEAMRIQRVDTILPEVKKLLPKATGSYAGAGVDFLGRAVGISTDGAKATAQLKTLSGQLVALMPKMSGPQSDKDVQMYREMAGELADDTKPIQTRLAALQTIEQLNNKYREINNRSGQLQQSQIPSSGAGGRPALSSFFK